MSARLVAAADRLLRLFDRLGALLLAALFGLTLAEIAARQIAGVSLSISLEYQGYLLIASALLPQGRVLRDGRALAFRLLLDRLSAGPRAAAEIAGRLVAAAAAAAMAAALWDLALFSLATGARSYFPSATALFWPQALAALGASGLALACLIGLLGPQPGARRQEDGA